MSSKSLICFQLLPQVWIRHYFSIERKARASNLQREGTEEDLVGGALMDTRFVGGGLSGVDSVGVGGDATTGDSGSATSAMMDGI